MVVSSLAATALGGNRLRNQVCGENAMTVLVIGSEA